MATGTVTVTPIRLPLDSNRGATEVKLAWTSDGFGDVDQSLLKAANVPFSWHGRLVRVSFVPDTVDVPTDIHHVKLLSDDGVDMLKGLGDGLSSSASRTVTELGRIDGGLQLIVDNAGAAKKGLVILHIERQVV